MRLQVEAAKRERAQRLLAQQRGLDREWSKLVPLAQGMWDTKAQVARARRFARAWTTPKAAVREWRTPEWELPAERWLLELALTPQELPKRRRELRKQLKLGQRPTWLRFENRRAQELEPMMAQARRAVERL